MRFPRNAKLFAGRFDAAPFLAVAFLLVMFFIVQSALVFTPGVKIQLPAADGLSGAANPSVAVAMDAAGKLYFDNQLIAEAELREKLRHLVIAARGPLTLVIQADGAVNHESITRLSKLATDTGFREALLGTRPRVFPAPPQPATP